MRESSFNPRRGGVVMAKGQRQKKIEFVIEGDPILEAKIIAAFISGGKVDLPIVTNEVSEREAFIDSIRADRVIGPIKGLEVWIIRGHFPHDGKTSWTRIPYDSEDECFLWGSFILWFNRTARKGGIETRNYDIRKRPLSRHVVT